MSSLPEPNRFQRWYFAWAEPRYARMPAELREQARVIDCYLYSRRGIPVWLGLFGCVAGFAFGLNAAGVPLALAIVVAAVLVFLLGAAGVSAWTMPDRFSAKRLWRIGGIMLIASYAGVFSALVARGKLAWNARENWLATIATVVWEATPFQLLAGLVFLLVLWVTASSRRELLQRQLARSLLEQERDQAARQASEARLQLLQAQIQPHFLFNTLAALQHWVDTGDARAAPLLRQLTAFLRGSTELLGRSSVTLADEADTVARYLDIMAARLGPRLAWRIAIDPACAGQALPPGLLITLVENAVEHGIEPALRGGTVEVIARLDGAAFELVVQDDGAGLAPDSAEGVGLANCRARLAHLFGLQATLNLAARRDGAGTRASIRLDRGT